MENKECNYIERMLMSADVTSNTGVKEVKWLYMWREIGNMIDKPLQGPFVAKLLNDLFGIQARGGCACAGQYGHSLLNVDESYSLAFRSAIQMGYNGVKSEWARIRFPYNMSTEEFEFILAALEFIAIYGPEVPSTQRPQVEYQGLDIQKKDIAETIPTEHSCNFCISLMADGYAVTESHFYHESRVHNDADAKDVRVIDKYASYLETAKHS